MPQIEIKKEYLRHATTHGILEPAVRQKLVEYLARMNNMHALDVELGDWPTSLWRAVLDEPKLPPRLRATIAMHVFGMREGDQNLTDIYETTVEDPVEFGSTLQMAGVRTPNCEMPLNGRWYPVILTVTFAEDEQKWARAAHLNCTLRLGNRLFAIHHYLSRELFLNESADPRPQTVAWVLEHFGYRRLQTTAGEFNLRLVKAERMAAQDGTVVEITGSVLAASAYSWWRGFESRALGTSEMPARCVVESALETNEEERNYYGYGVQNDESQSRLPFIRVFSLETKDYVYADIDDVQPYEFDVGSLSRLYLPPDVHSILTRVFNTPMESLFGDLLKGKHGGVVILASGAPGVGKTLTAEIYAETTERPLYVLELGELGTNPAEVEERLQRVFARVTRWNAVLQFDECEIFLAKRNNDLERSAIVGIFLRLLDYYRGLLFLTTNRPDVLDEAVISRVMLKLEYPQLTPETRRNIWKTMFTAANLKMEDAIFERLSQLSLNGRQIRNITRLTKILNPSGLVMLNGIQEALKFGCGDLLPNVAHDGE